MIVPHPENVNAYNTLLVMREEYPNRVVRLTTYEESMFTPGKCGYYATIDGVDDPWIWSTNCFAGKLVGDVDDTLLGRTLEEIGI